MKFQSLALKATLVLLAPFAAPLTASAAFRVAPEAPIQMTCVTEIPSTTIEAVQKDDLVHMHIYHHSGPQYAPISDSIITPADLDTLQKRASVIKKLGNEWIFTFKRSACNADTASFFQCIGEASNFEINGTTIHPIAISITDVAEKAIWGDYTHKNVSMDFEIEKLNYRIVMNYQAGECLESILSDSEKIAKGIKKPSL